MIEFIFKAVFIIKAKVNISLYIMARCYGFVLFNKVALLGRHFGGGFV